MKAIVKIGYDDIIMPFDDAIVLIRTFENAEKTEDVWNSETKVHDRYIGGSLPRIKLELITDDDYAVAKMRGLKPTTSV